MSWYNPVSWWLDSEAIAAGEEADRKNLEITKQLVASGAMTEADGQIAIQHITEGAITQDQAESQVNQAFVEGAKEGATTMANAVNSTLNFTALTILRAIPIWLWLVAGLALFFWMGGGEWFVAWSRGRLKK